jgi:cytochrome c-type biogenesis protein CcmH/NrfG
MIKLPILCALLLAAQPQDRTRVSAELSQQTAQVGETIVLAITIETPSSADIEIRMPQLPNVVNVVGTQESTQLHYAIPGGRRRTLTREIVLQPTVEGAYEIPVIEVAVGNNLYRTRPLILRVTASAAPSPSMSSGEAWLRVTMAPETVYVGQQTTMTAEAGFSEEVRLRLTRPPIFDTPAPTGFWVQDIPGGIRSSLRTVDGRVVEVQTKKLAYFPLTPGRFALKAARVILDVRQGFLYSPQTREVRSNSPRLTVLPLPEAGKPAGFRGAVGNYELQASVEPLTVAAGEPVQIRLQLSGRGNIKALGAPVLPQLVGAEVFAPTEASTTEIEGETVVGTKTFTYVVIPENEGTFNIPAINFSFFDPGARSYRTVNADPVQVTVMPAGATADSTVAPGSLRALRVRASPASLRWVRTVPFAVVQLVPLLILAALVIARRRKPRVDRSAEYLARLRAAERANDADVYRELDHVLRDAMRDPSAAPHARARAQALLERINSARFAPVPPPLPERAAIQRDVAEVINLMFAGRSTRVSMVPVLLLVMIQQSSMTEGTQAYDAGDYRAAITAFRARATADPTDASAWYNLANASYRAGDRGRAFHGWASALRLEPRSDDIVHNLRAAGNVEALRVRPPLAVRAEEWLLMAAVLWWIAALIIILAVARRLPVPRWVAAPLVLALVCLVTGWAAVRAPRFAIALQEQTTLLSEPTVRSNLVRNVRAGAVLNILETRGEWLRVATIDKREAWVAADDVAELTGQ